jgi:hypothetical protein
MNFKERKECVICRGTSLRTYFEEDKSIPMGNNVVDTKQETFYMMPYNIQQCTVCLSYQIKYIADLSILYENSFAGAYGSIRSAHNTLFASFITENSKVDAVCEIGAGNGELSDIILETKQIPYTIIDPSYCGKKENKEVICTYFENCRSCDISANTLVMSHVFEHFYSPLDILQKINSLESIQYIYLSFPDLESFIAEGTYLVLTPEHTFYIDNSFLIRLVEQHGFRLQRTYSHMNHSVFFEFYRSTQDIPTQSLVHDTSVTERIDTFFKRLEQSIEAVKLQDHEGSPSYIWPCSMHTIFCLSMGLPGNSIANVLDNSPLKIGKYLFGFNLECRSFNEVIESSAKKTILLAGGCYNREVLQKVKENKANTFYLL